MNLSKRILIYFLIIFLISYSYSVGSISLKKENISEKYNTSLLLEGGHLESQDGFKILFVSGSYYEMGYQHGFLLKDEAQQNIRAFLKYAEELDSRTTFLDMWNTTKKYIPPCYINEMHGIADGANIPFGDMTIAYMVVLHMDMQCFSYAAWSDATKDKNLYHVRSLDFPLLIEDPVTGKYTQENSVLIIRNPDEGLKSLCPSIAGGINFYEGINEEQISIGVHVCWSSDQTLKGIPAQFRIQKALDQAKNLNETINILTSNKTLGWNFIISDGKTSTGKIIETTANHSYDGGWNSSIEGKKPFWKIKNVVRRTNFFLEPTMASTQREQYNPSGITGFMTLFKGSPFFSLWRKYKAMSEEIQKNWGDIDLNNSISLLRKVYTGKTDFFMFIFLSLGKNSILCDFHQWTYCPETGDFAISFSNADKYSHENQLHYFNINQLFDK